MKRNRRQEPKLPEDVDTMKPWSDAMHKEHGHTVESPVEARAGFLDRPVLMVLVVSLLLVCGIYALIYLGAFGTS
jgi:hypothetical protein